MTGDNEANPEDAPAAAAEPAPAASAGVAEEESAPAMELDTEDTPSAPSGGGGSGKKRKSGGFSRELAIDPLGLPTKSKRERKSVEKFEADDFVAEKAAKAEEKQMHGRGTKLEDIESVRESIKASKMTGPQLATAHNLVFGGRGKDRLKKQQLLEFSGYLPVKEKGVDKDKQQEIDDDLERKFAVRANKLTVPGLKSTCDLFDVDRTAGAGEKQGKEFLVDKLLDFLGEPSKKLTKTWISNNKKKAAAAARKEKESSKKAKKAAKEESDDDDDEEEDDMFEEVDGKKMPTDKAIKKWVRAYVRCFNLDKATTKHAMETCSDKFGVDLSDKKAFIKQLLTEAMV
mmetsp:Transcript_23400/g.50755  ORF Transcript_23400/g.50755 Transcript_23400/m.50755 type:complete len:344 (+) Transcript_23400:103-1134(+)